MRRAGTWIASVLIVAACAALPGDLAGAADATAPTYESSRLVTVIERLEAMSVTQRRLDEVLAALAERAEDDEEWRAMVEPVEAASAELRHVVDGAVHALLELDATPGADEDFWALMDVDATLVRADDLLSELAEQTDALSDDAQLANVDLQNILQKQQQTLQMMSNISKAIYDTAQSVIRKMGG